ncbi:MAG: hypothetical protein HEQ13_19135 [Dolichospermum sp. DEX189]|nr:hypothetical protein [Dolichospermum sp. DEX189]
MDFKSKWVESIDQINREDWDNVFCNSKILKSYNFAQAIEKSCLQNFQLYYMLVADKSTIVSIVPCFIYSVEIETLSGNILKELVSRIRKIHPKFLMARILGVGSPVATCENHIGFISNISKYQQELLGNFVMNELLIFSEKKKTDLIIVKEIPENEINCFKEIFKESFDFYESLPNSFIPTSGVFKPYPNALRKKYRQRFYNALKESDKEMIEWEIVRDFSLLSNNIYELYMNVYQKSKYKFEKLNADFFKNINKFLPENSFVLVAKNSDNIFLAVELVLEEEDCLIPLYLGLNYQYTDNTKTYQNVIFRSLIEGQKVNKKYVVLGQTSYVPKSYSGCIFEKLYLGVYFKRNFFNIILKLLFPYLFPVFENPCGKFYTPYKDSKKEDLNAFMKSINRIHI